LEKVEKCFDLAQKCWRKDATLHDFSDQFNKQVHCCKNHLLLEQIL
jgi:hypothetical protein